jgi:hypothetical protein
MEGFASFVRILTAYSVNQTINSVLYVGLAHLLIIKVCVRFVIKMNYAKAVIIKGSVLCACLASD